MKLCHPSNAPNKSILKNRQGAEWHFLRSSLMSNIMSRQVLNKFIPALNQICDDFIDLLKVESRRGTINNFGDLLNLMALEGVCCLILGRRMGYLSNNGGSSRFAELVTAVKNIFVIERDSYYGLQLWKYIPTKLYRDFSKNEEIIYNIISDIVDNSLQDGTDSGQDGEDDMKSVFLTILQNEQLDIRDKKSGIIDTLTAGIQTVRFQCGRWDLGKGLTCSFFFV
jgi:ecdysone 20-monooxygenase